MNILKKPYLTVFFTLMFCVSSDSHADREEKIGSLFSWAEETYPNFFAPSSAPIKKNPHGHMFIIRSQILISG